MAGLGWMAAGRAVGGSAIDFNRDIRPVLTAHCTACHGGVKSAGGVSFVYREKALATGKSGERTIAPGRPDDSEMMRRVLSRDPDEMMPQPGHGPPLTDEQTAMLRQWIAEGAEWSEHWSLVPPVEPLAPVLRDTAWPVAPFDAWILAGLEADGMAPSPAADEAEWLRRVSLDLTGLPPAVEEFDAFQTASAADRPAARAEVVDRLLASPAFGERWTSVWLDLARYADTYGFEKDPHRDIWPWRDWVIRALNDDLPFDQFTIKQLAGDQLDQATADDVLATAFHRNTQNNTEGGTSDEEFRAAAVLDRINTTWTTWQATTFGCVQCHDHPYDPYPHEDYYRVMALFNNTEDADLDDDFPRVPVALDSAGQEPLQARWREAREMRKSLNDNGVKANEAEPSWQPMHAREAKASGGVLRVEADGRMMADGTLPVGVEYALQFPAVPGMTAFRLQIFPDQSDPQAWPERASVVSHLTVARVGSDGDRREVKLREVIADYLAGPFDPRDSLDGGAGGFGSFPVQAGPRWCVFILDEPLDLSSSGGHLEVMIRQQAVANANQQACPLRHFLLSSSTSSHWTHFMNEASRRDQWAAYEALVEAVRAVPAVAVPVQLDRAAAARRETRVWIRGNRLTKGEVVAPGLPTKVAPVAVEGGRPRLEMAQWLVSDNNPLTARVLANRLWAAMFGRGIVETLEDFGSSGARPSHPEVLDHLALRLSRHHRWSLKSFLREVALSATYAQTGRAGAALMAADPANERLARGPRQRLTAEMVRDHALVVSGLLSRKMFGPPVFPPQPEGVWNTVYSGAQWKTSEGEDRYRRSLYTYSRRTSGYPGLLTFDAPPRDVCTARRLPTNTPLQALVMMNDPAFIELAAALARRLSADGGTVAEQIARGCRWVTLEDPPAALVASLSDLYEGALVDYRARPETAALLGATPEAAAMTLVANTLLNADFALNR